MLNHNTHSKEPDAVFVHYTTPVEALSAGRAVAAQWRGRPVAVAREPGPGASLYAVCAIAGMMAGGSHVLDYGRRSRNEFHFLRDAKCQWGLFFRETPTPALELYGPGGAPVDGPVRRRLLHLANTGEGGLPATRLPGEWQTVKGGLEEYFARLVSLVPDGLPGLCCRFQAPDRMAQATGNQVLSVLGVRTCGDSFLQLDHLGRFVALRRGGTEVVGREELPAILTKGEKGERGMHPRRQPPRELWRWDGLMAGLMLLDTLNRSEEALPERMAALPKDRQDVVVNIPAVTMQVKKNL